MSFSQPEGLTQRPPDRRCSVPAFHSSCKSQLTSGVPMKRRMAIPNSRLERRLLFGGHHAHFPLLSVRPASPRANGHPSASLLSPGRSFDTLHSLGASVQFDLGRSQPGIADSGRCVAAGLALARNFAASVTRYFARLCRATPPASWSIAEFSAAFLASGPAPPLPDGDRPPRCGLLQTASDASRPCPQRKKASGYNLWPPLCQRLTATQGPVLCRGLDSVRPRRRFGQPGAPPAAPSCRQWLFSAVCVDGPNLLVRGGVSLPAAGRLPLLDAGAGPRQETYGTGRSNRHAGIPARLRYRLLQLPSGPPAASRERD